MKPIVTHVGRADWGANRFFGHSLENEIAGKVSRAQAMLMAITGREFSAEAGAVFDDMEVCTAAADPRIWPCKVAQLAGSFGSPLAGFAVAMLAQESLAVGGWSAVDGARYLIDLRRTIESAPEGDDALREVVHRDLDGGRRFIGYGVPFRPVDERVAAAERCLAKHGRDRMPFFSLARRVERVLAERAPLGLNMGGAFTAALLDLGLTPEEVRLAIVFGSSLALVANAVESARVASPLLQRLPDEYVEYKGPPPRRSPRFREPT